MPELPQLPIFKAEPSNPIKEAHFLCVCVCVFVSPRFTELYVEELEDEGDLRILVSDYLKCLNPHRSVIAGIIRLVFTSNQSDRCLKENILFNRQTFLKTHPICTACMNFH